MGLIKVMTQQPCSVPSIYIPFLFISDLGEQLKGSFKNSNVALVQHRHAENKYQLEMLNISDTNR